MFKEFCPVSATLLFAAEFIYKRGNLIISERKEWVRYSGTPQSSSKRGWRRRFPLMTGNRHPGAIILSLLLNMRRRPVVGAVYRSGIRFRKREPSLPRSRNTLSR